jgi:hypothetical protein
LEQFLLSAQHARTNHRHRIEGKALMDTTAYVDALLALPRMPVGVVKVSKDGAWVAWSWWGLGPAADVYVAPTTDTASRAAPQPTS